MTFIEEQAKKEVAAGRRIWNVILWILVIWWGLQGLAMLATPGWLLGLVFMGGAGYVYYRINGNAQGSNEAEIPKANGETNKQV